MTVFVMMDVRRATESEVAEIWRLTHDEYLKRGYIKKQPGSVFSHYSKLEWAPETTQLVAILDGDLVGTCTFTMDGPLGLHTDVDFHRETELIRKLKFPLASSWRFVVDSRCRTTHRVSQSLMKSVARELAERGRPVVLCTFHPRHIGYYQKRFGFEVVSSAKETKGLSNAPSVLMVGSPLYYSKIVE